MLEQPPLTLPNERATFVDVPGRSGSPVSYTHLYDAGFALVEESDKGYNQPAYDTATTQYTVQWTWCWREEVIGLSLIHI